MLYGYARVSSKGQALYGNSLENQKKILEENGCKEIFVDIYTGTKLQPELDRLLSTTQNGDTVIITKVDRLARNLALGYEVVTKFLEKGVSVHILNLGKIDNTPTGKLTLHIFLAFAEFEREMIIERMAEGKEIARLNPDYKEGRKKKFSKSQIEHALSLLDKYSYRDVVKMTGISKSTLIRAKKGEANESCN